MSDQASNEAERREMLRKKREQRIQRNQERISVIGIVLTAAVMLCAGACFILIDRPEMSQTENRMLATFPDLSLSSLFSGEFTAGIDTWYTDTIPGREAFKDYVAKVRGMFGSSSEDSVKLHGKIPTPNKQEETESEESLAELNSSDNTEADKDKDTDKNKESVTAAPTSEGTAETTVSVTTAAKKQRKKNKALEDPNINGEISNNILVYQNRGIMLYGGSFSNGEKYAEYVNAYKEDLPDVNVYSMVCPTPVSFYLPTKYSDMTASESDNIDHINNFLKDVTPVDVLSALDPHTDEKIYQNTDHHWSHLGAYYAAEEFAKTAGVPFADISKYDKETRQGYVGTLYGFTGDSDLKDNPEEFTYYIPKANYTTEVYNSYMEDQGQGSLVLDIDNIETGSWYCVFIGTDDTVLDIKTDVKNGRKLAVVKDSYGNALIPWLTSSFEEIYVVDMRYFDVNAVEQFKKWRITDLLFTMNTFSATGDNFEKIEILRTQ